MQDDVLELPEVPPLPRQRGTPQFPGDTSRETQEGPGVDYREILQMGKSKKKFK